MILKNDLLIRLMNDNDFEVMVKWLNDQSVLEFYEEPPSNIDMVIKKYGPKVEGKHYVIPCIVEYKNEPVGYIQYYELQEDELKRYGYSANKNIYGIDQFIGDTQLWGKGIGTTMILMMLNYLSKNKGASSVVLEVKKIIVEQYQVIRSVVLEKLKSFIPTFT
ncbi:acetyltransferase [Cytobacillus pseudoceanisediminis]|uniref:GNAT family N-acetyltransferase n=1 Tax=Cytobacillus pseudoceanisediminis TaxID=3051614 RepID=UPI00218843B9|nr:GNAT family N-acetyltransferase [Cytobacillus pseudoceanisediminis]UQX55205.1 acetyltransferase [Cytobacillus pseudoceanisediminis]